MKNIAIYFFLAFFIFVTPSIVLAQGIRPLIVHPDYQMTPDIYNDKVVFTDNRINNVWQVFLYDIASGEETQISKISYQALHPKIYRDKIVYSQYNEQNYPNIHLYDIDSGETIKITNLSNSDRQYPAIFKDKIVWADKRNPANGFDIYMFDLNKQKETQITNDSFNQTAPQIFKNIIVWQDDRNGNGNNDIFMYDLRTKTTTQITNQPRNQVNPQIYNNKIVWEDDRSTNADIYMFDIKTGTETQITNTTTDEETQPKIFGNKVVFRDASNNSGDIMLYLINEKKIVPVSQTANAQNNPAISRDGIIWVEYINGVPDIYISD